MLISDTSPYVRIMEEIKRRVAVAQSFIDRTSTALYVPTQIESTILQIRMIMELIALGSLAANKDIFEANRVKFEKHWNPVNIIKDLERLNPNFYPRPFRTKATPDGIFQHVFLEGDYLTKERLVEVHGRCGNLLHAKNPFGRDVDYKWFESEAPKWLGEAITLLNFHQIHLLGDDHMYVVQMEVEGGAVGMTTFELVKD